ncbi:MAG: hypothetical protein BIFFINMI_03137 [Phycisphaerae bacterium]|nr:hypothetical protein [Phycisphaerae bacterium]
MKTSMIRMAAVLLATALAARTPALRAADDDPFANNACVNCHRDLPGRSSEIVTLEWKQSVHHAAGVGCDGCHGGDPSVRRDQFAIEDDYKRAAHLQRNPDFLLMQDRTDPFVGPVRGRKVSYFCGKCHADIKEKHLGSPHGDFGDPTCLYCHGQGSHKITHPTAEEIIDTRPKSENGRCSPCHRAATMQAVTTIKKTLIDAEDRIQTSGNLYARLESWGYQNLELEKLHHHAREVRSQLRQIFHSFNMRDINNFASEIGDVADRTQATYDLVSNLRRTQRRQTVVGASAVGMLLLFAGLLVYYKRSFLDEH